jgi:hypothetical protein
MKRGRLFGRGDRIINKANDVRISDTLSLEGKRFGLQKAQGMIHESTGGFHRMRIIEVFVGKGNDTGI